MSESQRIKQVHKTMRDAGYERRSSRRLVGGCIYEAYYHRYSSQMTVFIPGNWSIQLRRKFINELKELLHVFSPKEDSGYAGVRITL